MDCQRVRTELGEYAAGELPQARRALLADHLGGCDGCREAFDLELALREVCEAGLVYSGPVYSFAQLKRRMVEIEPLQEVLVLLPKLQKIGAVPRFAVALALLVLYGGVVYATRNAGDLYAACQDPKILAQRDFVGKEFIDIYKTMYVKPPRADHERNA